MAKKRKSSLKGTSPTGRTNLSLKKVGNDLKGPGLILAGIAGAALVEKLVLSKITAIQEKEGNKMSKFYKPVIITAAGLIGRQMVPGMFKTVMDGMTVFGGIKTVNAATNKDVMTGLSGLEPYRELINRPPSQEEYVLRMLNQEPEPNFQTV